MHHRWAAYFCGFETPSGPDSGHVRLCHYSLRRTAPLTLNSVTDIYFLGEFEFEMQFQLALVL